MGYTVVAGVRITICCVIVRRQWKGILVRIAPWCKLSIAGFIRDLMFPISRNVAHWFELFMINYGRRLRSDVICELLCVVGLVALVTVLYDRCRGCRGTICCLEVRGVR